MKNLAILLSVAAVCSFTTVFAEQPTCDSAVDKATFDGINFIDMKFKCVKHTEDQIKKEITASLKYLNMAAYFSQDDINRPGFAKFFFGAASEEREHAHKLIEYLSMRGQYLKLHSSANKDEATTLGSFNITKLLEDSSRADVLGAKLADITAPASDSTSGLVALQNALKLEVQVTQSIRELIKECEKEEESMNDDKHMNHYHFVDYLTGEFLDEQYKGQRELAGKIATLSKMVKTNGIQLADFLFDKELL